MWEVHYFDSEQKKRIVAPDFTSKENALRFACTLEAKKSIVIFIEGPGGERIAAFKVVEWCKKQ